MEKDRKYHSTLLGMACALFSVLVWSGWMVASRYGVKGTLTPYDMTALRFGVAGMLLLPVAFKRGLAIGPWGLKGGLLLALLIGAPYTNIAIAGMRYAPVAHASTVINATLLVLTTAAGICWLKESTSFSHLAGVALSLGGILILLVEGMDYDQGDQWRGDLLFMGAGVMWGISVLLVRAWRCDPLHVAAVVCVFSMIFYLPFYLLFIKSHIGWHNWQEAAFQGFYQGILNSIAAFITFNMALQILGASRVGAITPLVPVLSTLLAIPLLHEVPSSLEWLAVGAVTCGVLLSSGILSRRPRPTLECMEEGL